jgi:hypothetical protein
MIHRKEVNTMNKFDNKALNEPSEDQNTPATTPVAEEKTSEEVTEPETKAELTEEVETKEEVAETEGEPKPEKEPRKGFSKRVRELNAKAKAEEKARQEAEEKAKSLEQTVAELTGSEEPQAGFQPTQAPPPDEPLIKPGEEIDALELDRRLKAREQKVIQRTDALIQLRGKQQETVNRINQETSEVVREYPQLDPSSDSFDEDLSGVVTEAVETLIRSNPYNASVKTFVGKLMKPYQRSVTKEVGKVTEDLAKQSSQSALKPSSIRKGDKSAEDMTPAELEKKLGIVQG